MSNFDPTRPSDSSENSAPQWSAPTSSHDATQQPASPYSGVYGQVNGGADAAAASANGTEPVAPSPYAEQAAPGQSVPPAQPFPPQPTPPGYTPNGYAPHGNGASAYAANGAAPGGLGVAQPGIVPLRPLTLSDLFEGTFKAIRSNPAVLFGFSVVVMVFAGVLTGVLSYYLTPNFLHNQTVLHGDVLDPTEQVSMQFASAVYDMLAIWIITALATTFLSGVLALAISDAVIGRKTDLASAWSRVAPRMLPLLGYTLLISLVTLLYSGIVVGGMFLYGYYNPELLESIWVVLGGIFVAFILLFIPTTYFSIRLTFAPAAIVLERQGPIASIARSWKLTRGAFWVTLGRLFVVSMFVSVAQGFAGGLAGIASGILMVLTTPELGHAVSTFLSMSLAGVFMPITASFVTLMYVDRRLRTEGLADALMKAASR